MTIRDLIEKLARIEHLELLLRDQNLTNRARLEYEQELIAIELTEIKEEVYE